MYCGNCRKKVPNEACFCPHCGSNNIKKNKKKYLYFIPVILIIIGIVFVLIKDKQEDKIYSSTSADNSIITIKNEIGIPKFIDGKFSNIKVTNTDDAFLVLDSLKEELKFSDVKNEFNIGEVFKSEDITYYKFNQKYKDINLYKTNVIISVDKNNNVLSFSGYYIPNIDVDINALVSKEDALDIVKSNLGDNAKIIESEKYIYADYENANLVYVIDGYSDTKQGRYIVDAMSKEIIMVGDLFSHNVPVDASINGINGLENVTIEEYKNIAGENKYRLVDSRRNITIVDGSHLGLDVGGLLLSWAFSFSSPMEGDLINNEFIYKNNKNEEIELARIGVTTLKQYQIIFDYYLNVLNRRSFDNKGSKIIVNIGLRDKTFGEDKLQNASWEGPNQMYIGYWNDTSFSKSLDVLAHEFTHGVIDHTADFASTPKESDINKAFETGSINEAYADILGSLIEGKNWLISEDIEILRSLQDPIAYSTAKVKGEEFYYPDGYLKDGLSLEEFLNKNNLETVFSYDGGGKHQNATVLGHAAYLMEDAFKNKEEMAKVWYNSLFLLSSYSNFEDAALAIIKSAKNLGLKENSIDTIRNAFVKVNILKNEEVTLSGYIYSNEEKLENVKIEIKNDLGTYEVYTDKDGKYEISLITDEYEISVSKNGFEVYNKKINLIGNTKLDVELAKKGSKTACKTDNCHTITMYFLDNLGSGVELDSQTFTVNDGEILGVDTLIKNVNDIFGSNIVKSNGESFKMTLGDYSIDFAWYYKDTDNKFDFNKPIYEDIEIEMKMFDGLIDSDIIKDVYDIFN